jgi:hypothetical protein
MVKGFIHQVDRLLLFPEIPDKSFESVMRFYRNFFADLDICVFGHNQLDYPLIYFSWFSIHFTIMTSTNNPSSILST